MKHLPTLLLALTLAAPALAADPAPVPVPAAPAASAAPKINVKDKIATVTLQGGAKVTGLILKSSDTGIVIDLGHDVVNIPANRILEVDTQAQESKAQATQTQDGLFTTGRLESAPVPDLVKRHGDAVVMIRTPAGLGSGFLISKAGHIVSNYHVIQGQTKLQVTLFRKTDTGYEKLELKKVKIIAFNPVRDLSLIQIDPEEVKGALPNPITINDKDDLGVGDLVFAVGSPLGLERTVTQGIVSSTTRTMENIRLIQTDAAINPGNSGGPLFNARGEVVGVVCAGASYFQGLAFGIPSSDLVDFLKHRDSYLYDPSQPQNGFKYMEPPFKPKTKLAKQ
jgi:serine protease Do